MTDGRGDSLVRLYIGLAAFAVAFGYLEAAIVVYLRQIYYPEGFAFPLVPIPTRYGLIEIGREAATIVMLGAVAALAGRRGWERFGHFAFLFGAWDIAFYLGLVATIGWPESILTWDILFLIPVIWTGPVLAPVLVAVALIGAGAAIGVRERRGRPVRVVIRHWVMGGVSFVLLLLSFFANHGIAYAGGVPERFPWIIFAVGLGLGIVTAIDLLLRDR